MNAGFALKTLAVTSLSLLFPVFAMADQACEPRVIESPTKFPMRAQLRGQGGTVLIDVQVDATGRASNVGLRRSSGHRLLDRAAASSVQAEWRFDISNCVRSDLPMHRLVAVEYQNDEYRN